jgi:hypothetical protein
MERQQLQRCSKPLDLRSDDSGSPNLRNELRRVEMVIRTGTVHLITEAAADGTVKARQLILVDGESGKREQVWPEVARPVLSVPINAE